jgi:hypothetical protein
MNHEVEQLALSLDARECNTCDRGLQPIQNFQGTLFGSWYEDSCLMCRLSKESDGICANQIYNPEKIVKSNKKVRFWDDIMVAKKTKKEQKVPRHRLPEDCSISHEDIPPYCSFFISKNGSSGFRCNKAHPKFNKVWETSTSKKLTIEKKFQQLLMYLG